MTGATSSEDELDPIAKAFIDTLRHRANDWGKMHYGLAVLDQDALYLPTLPKTWEIL